MKRIALLIGNSNGLEGVKKDLSAWKKFLLSPKGGAWKLKEIRTIMNPPKQELLCSIEKLKYEGYDLATVVYSGHGGYDKSTILEINKREETINETDLLWIAPRQISVFDCCRCLVREDEPINESQTWKKTEKKQIVVLSIALVCIFILVFSLFHKSATKDSANPPLTNVLTDSISQIVSACPDEIGVAVIVNNRDTVKVNNKSVYPMMSVFKVHQALALCNDFDNKGISLDTLVNINRDKLDPKTWSPMLKDYSGPVISLTVRDLLRYTLTQSDNNASNLMFKDMVNVAQTDSFIATLIPRSSFQIAYTEEEMSADHNKAYSNYTSPLGAAMLMNRLFTEGLIDDEKQSFIKNTLKECKTGVDRIAAPLLDKEGVVIAHKTGSGYVNENGVLAAHNDVAYICLPNNISYTLAVFVKDFKGNESQASQYVAHISAVVYSLLMQTSVKS